MLTHYLYGFSKFISSQNTTITVTVYSGDWEVSVVKNLNSTEEKKHPFLGYFQVRQPPIRILFVPHRNI